MSERRKTHNGRDVSGHFKVKQADVDDLETDRDGADFIRDDVRLGGAVACGRHGVADLRLADILHAGDEVAHLADAETRGGLGLG